MLDLAVLAPFVLLLLMLLLGRFERWLDDSTPPPPTRADRQRWRRTPRSVRAASSTVVPAGRRALARRAVTRPRRGAAVAPVPSGAAAVPRAARRHLLGGRLRHGGS